ncbi:hypothetical protein B0H19DRAFT_1386602 [Mycena capillaripes]|nr:hypothetical protein B0H19DRAFT_1386602 [Mycena capillaripes]
MASAGVSRRRAPASSTPAPNDDDPSHPHSAFAGGARVAYDPRDLLLEAGEDARVLSTRQTGETLLDEALKMIKQTEDAGKKMAVRTWGSICLVVCFLCPHSFLLFFRRLSCLWYARPSYYRHTPAPPVSLSSALTWRLPFSTVPNSPYPYGHTPYDTSGSTGVVSLRAPLFDHHRPFSLLAQT